MNPVRSHRRTESLCQMIRDLQCDVHRMFNDATELPSHGLRHTLFRRRNRVIEKASDLLNRSARLMLRVRHQEASDSRRQLENGCQVEGREEWRRLRHSVDELKESWRSIRNEDSDIVMESLVVDLGAGD